MVVYSCELCNFSTKIKTQYKTHQKTKKHQKNKEIYDANIGKKEHKSSTNARNEHKKSTNSINCDKKIRCEYCNSTFKTKANMKRHLKKYCK